MARSRKGGRPRKDGVREPNGRLARYPSGDLKPQIDLGTDELRRRKSIAAGSGSLKQLEQQGYEPATKGDPQREDADLTPLGILVARGLISERQHDAAVRFLNLHEQVFHEAPKLQTNGLFTRVPSGPGKDDAEQAIRRQQRAVIEWETRRDRYNEVRESLSLRQLETVRALAINRQIAQQDTGVFNDIIRLNIRGAGMLGRTGDETPIAVRRRIAAIRNALDRLEGARKQRWSDLSEAQRNAIMAAEPEPTQLPLPRFH